MAQLPPKIPTMTPSFSHHKATISSHPSWIDDFLDFSSSRRSAHRRSASDSATFFDECRPANHVFDRLDDDQLMSMFSDENATTSNPSTPSDHDSANDTRPKGDGGEVQSSCKYESSQHLPPLAANASESNVDPKRVKRILANRQSAQRSRVRKLQYISELERSVTSLQTEVSTLSPRVAYLDHQRLILNVDNSALKQRIAALAQDKIFKDAHQEALKKELERLRQVYQQQNQENMGNNINTSVDIIEHEQQDQK